MHLNSLTEDARSGFELACVHADALEQFVRATIVLPDGVCLAAVGGLGRRAVAPRSDADLWLLTAKAHAPANADDDSIFYALWDSALPFSHQWVHPAGILEGCLEDFRTQTSLLDLRYLAGPAEVHAAVVAEGFEHTFATAQLAAFFERVEAEVAARHRRFGGSVYLLEPDLKQGPGGMRDLDCARWVARARYRVGASGFGFAKELVQLGVLLPREAAELDQAEAFLWKLRSKLHLRAGRRADRLSFDAQELLAREFGYAPTSSEEGSEALALGVEHLMQEYYQHARVVMRARESLAQRCLPLGRRTARAKERVLGLAIVAFDDRAAFAKNADLQIDPAAALRLYALGAAAQLEVLPAARDLCVRHTPDPTFAAALRAAPEAAARFVELLCDARKPAGRGEAHIEALHATGLLLAMIPEFAPVTGRVHHDLYHVFTVDVHSVAALRVLAQLRRGEPALAEVAEGEAVDDALPRRLAAEVVDPRALCIATLLHDVGKGFPEADGSRKNHSARGAELAIGILQRLALPEPVACEVVTLIAQHLSLYHLATRRDLDDVQTTRDCAALVGTRETLRNLYLLTLADLRTTSPKALTAWKARMLEELYLRTDRYLEGSTSEPELGARANLIDSLVARGHATSAVEQFVDSFPPRYAATVEQERAEEHLEMSCARAAQPFATRVDALGDGSLLRVTVLADDRPGLLARIAAALWAARLSVLSAQLYSRVCNAPQVAEAVDVFYVRSSGARAVDSALLVEQLTRSLASGAPFEARAPSPLAKAGRAAPGQVLFDDRASQSHTVIEVFGRDRPGLLFAIANTLAELQLTIAVAKINTEGDRIADVFYVSEASGSKLTDDARRAAVGRALRAIVDDNSTQPDTSKETQEKSAFGV